MSQGHLGLCNCQVCLPFRRIGQLLQSIDGDSPLTSFAAGRLRQLECDLRDEADKVGSPVPPPPPGPPGYFGQPPEGGKAGGAKDPFAKGAVTPQAPSGQQKSPLKKVKGEPESVSESEIKEPQTAAEEPKKEESKEREVREKSNSQGKARESKAEPSRREKSAPRPSRKKRSRSRRRKSRKEEEEGSEATPKAASSSRRPSTEKSSRKDSRGGDSPSGGGKEKKSRPERPPEPALPPRVPRGPVGTTHVPKAPGPGWIGRVPYSDHPRWHTAVNKGITKRAKQEIRDRRGGRDRHWR